MFSRYHLSLKPGALFAEHGDALSINADGRRLTLRNPGLIPPLAALAGGGGTLPALQAMASPDPSGHAPLTLAMLLQRLARMGWLRYTVLTERGPAVAALPVCAPEGDWVDPAADGTYILSRFAYCQGDGGRLTLKSPLSYLEFPIHDPRFAALVALLAEPRTADGLASAAGLDADAVALVIGLLHHGGIVTQALPDGGTGEAADVALRQWEFHDLLVHTRARGGWHDRPSGGTYRFLGEIPPLPAVKPAMREERMDLYRPDTRKDEHAQSLFRVLDDRRSIREYGDAPLTARRLGEFLYRCARIGPVVRPGVEEVCARPYPSGGGLHELELYILVNRCEGIPPGLYHFLAHDHQLCRLSGPGEATEALLQDAAYSTGGPRPPHVLVIIATRFQRLSWKYEAIAYSTLLKNLGCLLQTMYLVATALDLAPCAIGGGNSQWFARAAGLRPFVETSVGEFALGTRPTHE